MSNKNKSSSTADTTSSSRQVSLQDTDGVSVVGNELSSATINLTDGGAVAGMENVTSAAIEQAATVTLGIVDRQLKLSEFAIDSLRQGNQDATAFAMAAGRPETVVVQDTTRTVLIVGGIIAAGIAIKAIKG